MTAPSIPSEQDLRYPIGPADKKTPLAAGERAQRIDFIAALPAHLRKAVSGLTLSSTRRIGQVDGRCASWCIMWRTVT